MKDGVIQLTSELLCFLESTAPAKLCVACSGGSDSMALLSLMLEGTSLRHRLIVLHFNHGTRGDASDGDADFVQNLSNDAQIPVVIGRRGGIVAPHLNEDFLRRCRFQFFHREMARLSTPYLLTAHNRDDVVETFLMRLARGVSVDGLVALRPVEHRTDGRIYVRPLLSFSKDTLRDYLLERNIPWREDASNASELHLRNRVRHRLIPLWKTLEPQRPLESCLLRTRNLLTEDAEALGQLSQRCFQAAFHENRLALELLRDQPLAILRRVFHLFFLENGYTLERALADHLLNLYQSNRPFKVSVTPDLTCVSNGLEIFLHANCKSPTR
ncbi:MAG: tRNA lysidine(34) synthetase TilS [Puniceicoccales bacterium]|jgi:tRNA(Ile)-lysidine synthase|nr:tRNA lysidine(34) synthetase TilS [Puniceicoccales bacterium]